MGKSSRTNLQIKPKEILLVSLGVILATIVGVRVFEPDLSTISVFKNEKVTPPTEKQLKMIAAPQEHWTQIGPPPFKMQSPEIVVEKEKKILARYPVYVRNNAIKKSLPQILEAYERGLEKRDLSRDTTLAPTSTNLKWKDWELDPILILYSNWEENPIIFPKVTTIKETNQEILEVLPANDTARKTPIQSLQTVILIYPITKDWRGKTILIKTQCQKFNIDLPIGADPIVIPSKPKADLPSNPSDLGSNTDGVNPTPKATSQFVGPKIRARLISSDKKLDRWKQDFIATLPNELEWAKDRLHIRENSQYLELQMQTTRGFGIRLNPALQIRLTEPKR